MTAQRRHALEEMKKRGERQAVKSRLAYFVYQKLLNHFGSAQKATIAACVEAYFEVKSSFTSEDIVGLEMVIRESIARSRRAEQQPKVAASSSRWGRLGR